MSERVYPRKVWVLMPSFKPVEVEIVQKYNTWGREDYGDLTEKGKRYSVSDMYRTKESAIASGIVKCDIEEQNAKAKLQKIYNRRQKLEEAEKGE